MMWMGKQAQRAVKVLGAALALALLGACGGGTEQIDPFRPTRLLVFGDEMSVLTKEPPQGRKYSVNALGSDGVTLDCGSRRLWFQVVASAFGFGFEACPSSNETVPRGTVFAEVGAKVDDLPAQIARAAALTGCFNETDLVTILLGANDVLDVYRNQYVPDPAMSYQDNPTYRAGLAELRARGVRLAQLTNRLTRLGPKVIISTIPLLERTPYARQQALERPNADVSNVLSDFSNTFNTAMRAGDGNNNGIINNGLFIGLVELDALLNAAFNNPGRYGLNNVTQAVCAVGLPNCTTDTLVPGGSADNWLWASDLWIGSTAHQNLGSFARNRATGNPFGSPNGTACRAPPPSD